MRVHHGTKQCQYQADFDCDFLATSLVQVWSLFALVKLSCCLWACTFSYEGYDTPVMTCQTVLVWLLCEPSL